MSVLRRAKLRTPDGIESIEYPLGVDAENVEVANRENLSQRLVRIDEDLEKNEKDIAAVSELAGTNKQNIGANEIRIDALERKSASVDKKPYYFNTVADMKAYQELKVGDMAITLGYYEANDGGQGLYQIVDDDILVDDSGSIHDLISGLKAKLVVENNTVNVKQFGAKGNDENDDTIAIQKTIDFGENKNLKIIIPNGTYRINYLKLKSNVLIDGLNKYTTILKHIGNGNCIELYDDDVYKLHINNFSVQGNENSLDLIHLNLTERKSRPVHIKLNDIELFESGKGNGLYVGNSIVGCTFENIKSYKNGKYGVSLYNSTDCFYYNIECFHNTSGGIFGTTYSSKFIQCKSWANYGTGITVNCGRNTLIGCESQESAGHGFEFTQGRGLECYGLISDRNGVNKDMTSPEVKTYYSIKITNASYIKIFGSIYNFRANDLGVSEKAGLYVSNVSNSECNLNIETGIPEFIGENSYFNNNIKINDSLIANSSKDSIITSTNGTIGHQIIANDGVFTLIEQYDSTKKQYYQQLNSNGSYVARTNIINEDGSTVYGCYGKATGFFGSNGTVKQNLGSVPASDLNSTMTLLNNLVNILKGYGLIG